MAAVELRMRGASRTLGADDRRPKKQGCV